jgi:hypothetical protein
MKKIIFLVIGSVTTFSVHCCAQQKTAGGIIKFHSFNTIGLMEGQAGSAFQLQAVNGLQYKSWFYGIGVGLDYYRLRTIPLFADVRKEFGKTDNKFFVYADAGANFYWKRDKDVKQFYIDDKFKNGFYGEAGLGYKLNLNRKLRLAFSAGYSYKKLTEEGYNFWNDPGFPNAPYPIEKINYNLNRLAFKIGIEF